MTTSPSLFHLPPDPATERDTVELTQQVLAVLSPTLGAHTLDSTQYGAALGFKARDRAWVRVLPVPSLEQLGLPLAQGLQTGADEGVFTAGWPATPLALQQPLPEQYLLWWSQAQGCALLVPAQAWWQAGWDLWLALAQASLAQDQVFRPKLQWRAAPPQPTRWLVQAMLPSAWWLRALERRINLDDVLLMGLRDSANAPTALLKAYSALQVLPSKTLPSVKALSTTLLHAAEDPHTQERAKECARLTPLSVALAAQCAYAGPTDWAPHHQSAAAGLVWRPDASLLQSAHHGPWPSALQGVHLRSGLADSFESWPAWTDVEAGLGQGATPETASSLKRYFDKAHF